ncbi:hypothetical protein Tco_0952902 [Tanacetum coccineum]|uniref:Uncharacterized protein n=1 Tax=Tanacetum coccineum TaxID=301880 RepID=A0ABQ5DYB9_9ASTR
MKSTDFSRNIIMLIMNAILGMYTKFDEVTNLKCDYLEALEKCDRLEKELSKRTENINNKSFNELSKRFSELEQHSVNLELALQQNLKAQLQDKSIAISELKKLIEKMKRKFVETKFEKSSVIRQPNAFKSQRQSILARRDNSIRRRLWVLKAHYGKSQASK